MSPTPSQHISVQELETLFSAGKVMLFKCSAAPGHRLTYISDNVESVLGFPPAWFLERNPGWSTRIHPDDRPTVMDSFQKVRAQGTAVNEYRFRTESGRYLWLRDRMQLIRGDEGEPRHIVGYSWVVAQQVELNEGEEGAGAAEEETETGAGIRIGGERFKPYEFAIAQCSHLLLNNRPKAVQRTLRILLRIAGADRAYIFENHTDDEGRLCASQRYEATRGDIEPQIDNPELQALPYDAFPWWKQELSHERIINEVISNMPEEERSILEPQGIRSLLIIPVYVDGEWSGFIGFDDMQNERYWTPDEVQLLHVAAEIYGSYRKWVRSQDLLKVQKDFSRAVIDSLPGLFLAMDARCNLLQWNANVEAIPGLSPAAVSAGDRNFWQVLTQTEPAQLDALLDGGRLEETEIPVHTGDGCTIPYLWNIQSFHNGEQPVRLAVGIDISELKHAEASLKESLHEKQILLQEIHHRVKNNLAIISSLLQLQIFEVDDPELSRRLKESQTRIQTMALIHEQLYHSENLTRIELPAYIRELVRTISDTYNLPGKDIRLEYRVDEVELNINKAIPLALLINEILTNAYEHAFTNRETGTILIGISEQEDRILLTLSDDGVGMDSLEQSDEGAAGGLGLKLIRSLVSQLEADYETDLQDGVSYAISFSTDFAKGSGTILEG